VIGHTDQDVNLAIGMSVNNDRGEVQSCEEEVMSTLEDVDYVLDKFHYALDVSEDLEEMGFDLCRYSD